VLIAEVGGAFQSAVRTLCRRRGSVCNRKFHKAKATNSHVPRGRVATCELSFVVESPGHNCYTTSISAMPCLTIQCLLRVHNSWDFVLPPAYYSEPGPFVFGHTHPPAANRGEFYVELGQGRRK
jgi:hypothetical protein